MTHSLSDRAAAAVVSLTAEEYPLRGNHRKRYSAPRLYEARPRAAGRCSLASGLARGDDVPFDRESSGAVGCDELPELLPAVGHEPRVGRRIEVLGER